VPLNSSTPTIRGLLIDQQLVTSLKPIYQHTNLSSFFYFHVLMRRRAVNEDDDDDVFENYD